MAVDPYEVLGVTRGASPEAIRRAYRGALKAAHPDLHPDVPTATERLMAVQRAWWILGDPGRKRVFDTFGPSAESIAFDPALAARWEGWSRGVMPDGGVEDGGSWRLGFRDLGGPAAGPADEVAVGVSLREAVLGAEVGVIHPHTGAPVAVALPPGTFDGQAVALDAEGRARVRVSVRPDGTFRRVDDDLHTRVVVDLDVALFGGSVPVPTLGGSRTLALPPRAPGQRVVVPGQGVPAHAGREAGALVVEVDVQWPDLADTDEARALLRALLDRDQSRKT